MTLRSIIAIFLMMPGSFVALSFCITFISTVAGVHPALVVGGMLLLGIGIAMLK